MQTLNLVCLWVFRAGHDVGIHVHVHVCYMYMHVTCVKLTDMAENVVNDLI